MNALRRVTLSRSACYITTIRRPRCSPAVSRGCCAERSAAATHSLPACCPPPGQCGPGQGPRSAPRRMSRPSAATAHPCLRSATCSHIATGACARAMGLGGPGSARSGAILEECGILSARSIRRSGKQEAWHALYRYLDTRMRCTGTLIHTCVVHMVCARVPTGCSSRGAMPTWHNTLAPA